MPTETMRMNYTNFNRKIVLCIKWFLLLRKLSFRYFIFYDNDQFHSQTDMILSLCRICVHTESE